MPALVEALREVEHHVTLDTERYLPGETPQKIARAALAVWEESP